MTSDFLSRGTEGELSFTKGMDGQAFLFTRNIYPTPKTQDAPRDFAFPFPRFDSSFLIFLFLLVSQVLHILVEEPSFNPMGANNPKTLSSQPSSGQGHACCPVLPSREPPGGWNQIPQSPTIEAMATQDRRSKLPPGAGLVLALILLVPTSSTPNTPPNVTWL